MRNLALLFGLALCAACASEANLKTTPIPTDTAKPEATTTAPAGTAEAKAAPPKDADPYLWLEDVLGDKPLAWVAERNAKSKAELEAAPGFFTLRDRLRRIYDSKERIPFAESQGKLVYNFWRDDANPRGLWRRTSLAEYKKASPKWETVIDLDALAKTEKENWVWHGARCLYPKYDRCLVLLSRGGADAEVVREFDTVKKQFVEGGFSLPEAKSSVEWKDLDTLFVGTDFGPGSMTDSGYPRIVKEWKRGTKLAEAKTLFEAQATDMVVQGEREHDHGTERDVIYRRPSFFTEELYVRDGDKYVKIEKPLDAESSIWDGQLLLKLRSAWTVEGKTYPAGALVVAPLDDFRKGKRDMTVLFEPKPNTSLESYVETKTTLLTVELEDVKTSVYVHTRTKNGFVKTKVETRPMSSASVWPFDRHESDDYWLSETGFTTPSTLSLGTATKKAAAQVIKKNPDFFESAGLEVTQHFATSKDGTKVPYFQIAKKGLVLDGKTPTLLEGYGGFESSQTPYYDSTTGAAWLERGGVYVVANIRGGGEYGPSWHKAALKENRQRAYDDFIAIAEDLIARKVTTTPKLGIMGASNGGLLMGVMLTQRPDLFGAVVCQVPLLDMTRYHKLLAGASWMEEYGDPDKPEEKANLLKYSPYQNVKSGTKYPRTLFTTSTRDDRVHPGHARKMVARMLELGQDLLYYENTEGGHGGAANNEQRAYMYALAFTFLSKELGLPAPAETQAKAPAPAPAKPAK